MIDNDLAFASAVELSELIAQKRVSPVELTELYLGRIESQNPKLNAYLTVASEEAVALAREAEAAVTRGDNLGPLHGVPIVVKDLDLTKGMRTTYGSLIYEENVADEDSIHVEQLREAGAIILGKSNTPEFGFLGRTENRLGKPCGNPWNPERTAGGSSGGSASAVAAGLCALGTGGDGGGSIRIPASFCGLYGIKPTQGRVPYYAGRDAPSVANQLGQLGGVTRTVSDSALLLNIVSGYDSRDPGSSRRTPPDFTAALERDIRGLRVAWSADYGYAAVDPEVVDVTYRAAQVFEELGCEVEESDLAMDEPFDAFWTIFSANGYAGYKDEFENHGDKLTDYVRECLEHGKTITGAEYGQAVGYVDRLKDQVGDVFEKYDLLLSPTMAVPAFPHGHPPGEIGGRDVHWFWGYLPFTYPINMVGHTAASVPCGFSKDGLPIGLHIVGRRWDEEMVLAASAAFERAKPWAEHRPPVA